VRAFNTIGPYAISKSTGSPRVGSSWRGEARRAGLCSVDKANVLDWFSQLLA